MGLPASLLGRLWGAASLAGGVGLATKWGLTQWLGPLHPSLGEWGGTWLLPPRLHPLALFAATVLPFGATWFGLTWALGLPEAHAVLRRLLRRRAVR